ncbi:MAG: choice-of-anchor B family protein [Gemmatimonadota bacterium]
MASTRMLLVAALLAVPAAVPAQTYVSAHPALPAAGFASAMVMDGSLLYVGRTGAATGMPIPPSRAGSVHVFERGAAGFREIAMVEGSDAEIGDGFGTAIAAHGAWLAVGAPQQGGGSVYIFQRAGSEWRQVAKLAAPAGPADAAFGSALGISDGFLFVGAPQATQKGVVYAYDAAAGWRPAGELAPSDPADSRLGRSISVQGNQVLVGAPGPGGSVGGGGMQGQPGPGAAYLFERDGSGWRALTRLAAPAGALAMGTKVHLGEGWALASAPITGNANGALYEFTRGADGTWAAGTPLKPEAQGPTIFGADFVVAGEDLLVGAPMVGQFSGVVYVFGRQAGTWTPKQTLTAETQGMAGFFGMAVAGSGDVAVLGAPGDDFWEGTGFVFRRGADGTWTETSTVTDAGSGLEAITGGQVDCSADGMAASFGCQDVDLVSFLPASALGAERGIMVSDIWGWTDSESNREYALIGRFDGTSFVDVTDPAHPVYLGNLPLTEGATKNLWRDIKVYKDHAFVVADAAGEHGVQIFDLTRLRDFNGTPETFSEDAHYSGIHSAHNIVINEETGFAYAVGSSMGGETCGGGLHMIDIRDPRNPMFAGCFSDPLTGNAKTGYSHDAMCTVYHGPDTEHQDKEICFGANETALSIADVTDKANPVALSRASYPNVAYSHQGWISDDHRYFFLDDELDELSGTQDRTRTLVWDIADLDDPVLLTEYKGETAASDHNLYVKGNLMYESNYVAGLRIIDISDPANPREVAHFDTVPWGDDAPGFAGSWSNYPYFKSGNIIVSSMREGLFVLRKRERPVS